MTFKRLVRKTFRYFGLEVNKINKEIKNISFDEIYKKKIKKNPIIFDVGANKGQSIERFKKIFENPIIYAFEPIKFEFDILKEKYSNDENVILNNYAIGDKNETKDFNIMAQTGNSSFNKLTPDTDWLKKRSKQFNTTKEGFVREIQKIQIKTLDYYCEKNNITNIDLLKIDTQGYEDKVLKGCKNTFEKNIVASIESEIMLDNVYEKYFTFSDYEKILIPQNFRLVGINTSNNNLFSGIVFFADILYFNKKKFDI
jgi:FkbM family methyltransferase